MIGSNMKRIRTAKKLTLSEVAEKANISKSYLSNMERNFNDNPSIHIVEKIAEVLEVHVIDLLVEKSEKLVMNEEWLQFIERLKQAEISPSEAKDYQIIFEFMKWKKNKEKQQ